MTTKNEHHRNHPINLIDLAEMYLADRLGMSDNHTRDIRSVARRCAEGTGFTNGEGLPPAEKLCAWLQSKLTDEKRPLSRASVARYRRILRALYAWGEDRGIAPAVKIPTIKQHSSVPEAWTVEQVAAIVKRAKLEPGKVADIPACQFWEALLLTTYWTGARIGSILETAPGDWDASTSTLIVVKTKNGNAVAYRLHKQAASAVDRIVRPDAKLLFPWPHSRSHLYHTFRRIALEAGVPCAKSRKGFGLFHRLRRTMLSYCWAVDPNVAQRQADHSTAAITKRHYVDPRIVSQSAISAADILPVLELGVKGQVQPSEPRGPENASQGILGGLPDCIPPEPDNPANPFVLRLFEPEEELEQPEPKPVEETMPLAKRRKSKPRKQRRKPQPPTRVDEEDREREPELLPNWTRNVTAAPEHPLGDPASRGIEVVPPSRNGKGNPGVWLLRWNDPHTGKPVQMEAGESEQFCERLAGELCKVLTREYAIIDGDDDD